MKSLLATMNSKHHKTIYNSIPAGKDRRRFNFQAGSPTVFLTDKSTKEESCTSHSDRLFRFSIWHFLLTSPAFHEVYLL